ncbi:MAG: phenylalanine--tRNA ligase subunit beta [Kiritimatiellae bacterium]|nr:phenylalanine--tRNA ligase subunit beta [Kiritimatiellia bacterium]
MRVPLSWLNEFVKIDDIKPEELAEKLTRAGLQVETIETIGQELLSELFVVVDVLECEDHPNSDHLHVCKVSDGTEEYQVVCGAPNMRKGIKTAFAKIGAVVPEGGFKIKKGKLRGVESFGMCCSSKELKLGDDHSGIMEFSSDIKAGTLVRDVVSLEKPEVVLDIEVTWNRPDALSVIGIARDFAAILGRPWKWPEVDFVESDEDVTNEVKVQVEDTLKCPRYTARVITSVNDGPSPELIAKRLELCGMRSLGLVVDVTNYVLMELGAPLHAFDHTTLKDRTIVVRTARDGEKIKTLDGIDRELDTSMLVICDAEKPNAVAGVMGGEESEIAQVTRSVMLESALFDPASTKYTATKLGISSEASYRYIRGVDKDIADFASRRAAHLLQKYGDAKIARGVIDVDNRTMPLNDDVELNFDRVRALIGIDLSNDKMVSLLESVDLKLVSKDETKAVFKVPSWRWDISLEADLAEEAARLYGLDNIPDEMPSAPSVSTLDEKPFKALSRVSELCMSLGFSQAMHYSFLSARELDDFDDSNASSRLVIPDPVSVEYGVMRPSLMPQMYQTLGRNASHEPNGVMLFETGKVFFTANDRPCEKQMLCLGFCGPVGREILRRRPQLGEEEAVLWMKGAVELLLKRLHAGKVEFSPVNRKPFAAALEIKLNGKAIGVLGAVDAAHRHPFRLTTQLVLAELEVKMLLKHTSETGKVSPVPQFPGVMRDIAVKAKKGVKDSEITQVIRANGGKNLVKVELFDVFKDSRAYSLEFRSPERTLTDEEVGQAFDKIVEAVKQFQ